MGNQLKKNRTYSFNLTSQIKTALSKFCTVHIHAYSLPVCGKVKLSKDNTDVQGKIKKMGNPCQIKKMAIDPLLVPNGQPIQWADKENGKDGGGIVLGMQQVTEEFSTPAWESPMYCFKLGVFSNHHHPHLSFLASVC